MILRITVTRKRFKIVSGTPHLSRYLPYVGRLYYANAQVQSGSVVDGRQLAPSPV